MYWIFGILLLSVLLWMRWRLKNWMLLATANQLPGPRPLPVIGNALLFMCQPEELIKMIRDLITEYGDVLRLWFGPDLNVILSDPEDLKAILSSSKTSTKGHLYKYMAAVLGTGILSGSGTTWRRHRKIATPNYGKRAVESYTGTMNREVDLLLQKYKSVPPGQEINIYDYIVQTTSYTVCQTLMGLNREEVLNLPHLQYLIENTPRLYDIVFDRMTKWWLQLEPIFWLTKYNKVQNKFINCVSDFSQAIIKNRINTVKHLEEEYKINLMKEEDDLLTNTQLSVIDRFILSKELNDFELVKETFTVFTSSQEATAKISSFLLLMMAYHPNCQEKLYEEISRVIGIENKEIADEDLKRLPYLDMVFKEVVRLYPIGAILQRNITEDFPLKSITLPSGCSVIVPIYHLHRDPRYWRNPERFDPERFSAENCKRRQPNCYIPFSLGPMDCLGRHFAIKFVKTICVKVLQEFEVSSSYTYDDLKVIISISAVSVDGFHAKLSPRNIR